ncbi:MATE family efflux transporter, partial [candidate division WOR-3 bacterium]|nr:MATE family efflux transporter [candidate division WOR-3 bacterium]
TDTLVLGILIASVFIIIGFSTMKPLFTVLGAKGNVLKLVISYMSVWYLGAGFVFIPMIGNSAIRGTGDTKTPSIIMLIAISLNVLLDPLLIFGFGFIPALGLKGAAIATVSSRFFTMLAAFFVLIKREKLIEISRPVVTEVFNSWKKVLYIGIPASATNLIIPVSMGIITRLISEYGTVAVAGFGVAIRIEMLALSVIHALSSGMVPFVGQNFGAKKISRVIKSIKYSHIFSMIYGLFSFGIFLLTAHLIAGIFDNNPDVINTTALYLHIVSISFGFYGIMLISSSSFNAINKPYPAIMIAFLRMFIIYIPLAFIGSRLFGIKGIFLSASLSNFIAGTVAYFWIKRKLGTVVHFV